MRLGVGIIGVGKGAINHSEALRHLPDQAILVGVADRSPTALKAFGRSRFVPFTYTNGLDLINRSDIDLIVVATPPAFHREWCQHAAEVGKYVVCEKPLAASLADARGLLALEKRFPGKISVGYQRRFTSQTDTLRAIFRGRSHEGPITIRQMSRTRYDLAAINHGWWGDPTISGGGVLMTRFIHEIDLWCHLLGEPETLRCVTSQRLLGLKSEDYAELTINFSKGIQLQATCELSRQPATFSLQIADANNKILFENVPKTDSLSQKTAWRRLRHWLRRSLSLLNGLRARPILSNLHTRRHPAFLDHVEFYQSILPAIQQQSPLPSTLPEAMLSFQVVLALYDAARTGQEISFQAWRSEVNMGHPRLMLANALED